MLRYLALTLAVIPAVAWADPAAPRSQKPAFENPLSIAGVHLGMTRKEAEAALGDLLKLDATGARMGWKGDDPIFLMLGTIDGTLVVLNVFFRAGVVFHVDKTFKGNAEGLRKQRKKFEQVMASFDRREIEGADYYFQGGHKVAVVWTGQDGQLTIAVENSFASE